MRQSIIAKIFENAVKLDFNDSSRLVMMSDCHRSDGSASDNFAPNRNIALTALNYYYRRSYTYFELGDGDELWENKSFEYISAANADIFEILSKFYQAGRLYLIYGNHDMIKKNAPHLYKDFPSITFHEGIVLKNKHTQLSMLLLHGHQVDFFNYYLWPISRFLVRYLWKPLELIGVKDPASPALSLGKKTAIDQKLYIWARENRHILIAGHTHKAVFPKPGESLYFNDGCCVHPHMIFAIEITNSEISLVKWSVKVRGDGVLYIGRDVLGKPEKITDYYL